MAQATKNRTRLRAAIAAGVLSVLAAGGFMISQREKAPEYQTAEVVRGDLEVTISAAGKVQPKNYVDVGAQVSGQLENFLAEVGDTVEKGALLAEIDETLAASRVEADRAQLRELAASSSQQEASLELARANAKRADMLYKADAISEAEHQAAAADFKIASARLEQLKAQIDRQSSTLEGDLANLSYTKIFAPMDGTIVSQTAVEGQTLNANQTTPTILRIADLSVMTVEAEVSEADVLRVKPGQDAYFTTLGDPGRKWKTTVRQVLPQPEILNDVVLYKVLLDVQNEEDLLKPEMTAQVFFVSGSANNAVLAPVAALRNSPRGGEDGKPGGRRREGGNAIMAAQAAGREDRSNRFDEMRTMMEANPDAERKMTVLITDNGPRPRPVLVGISNRSQAEILWGLEPGDMVVTGEITSTPRAGGDDRRQRPPRGFGRKGPRG